MDLTFSVSSPWKAGGHGYKKSGFKILIPDSISVGFYPIWVYPRVIHHTLFIIQVIYISTPSDHNEYFPLKSEHIQTIPTVIRVFVIPLTLSYPCSLFTSFLVHLVHSFSPCFLVSVFALPSSFSPV